MESSSARNALCSESLRGSKYDTKKKSEQCHFFVRRLCVICFRHSPYLEEGYGEWALPVMSFWSARRLVGIKRGRGQRELLNRIRAAAEKNRIAKLRREDYEWTLRGRKIGVIMKIAVNEQIHLSEFHSSDKTALIEHLSDRDIYDRTLRIPFPYTEKDADEWLALYAKATAQQGRPVHFAIRSADDALIGGCGFNDIELGRSHRAEVGYWLAKPLWGRGIMTAVVQRVCQHAFVQFGLVKIIAHVHPHNSASVRVLEKSGFQEEGFLRKHHLKDGKYLDARLFALLR